MERLRELLLGTLDRVESELIRRTRLSGVRTALQLTDPAFLTPSPSMALMRVDAEATVTLGTSTAFRALNLRALEGEVLFTPVAPSAMLHPWRVGNVSIIPRTDGSNGQQDGGGRRLRVVLTREADSDCRPGWLSLNLEGVEGARVYWEGYRLETRSGFSDNLPQDLDLGSVGLARHYIAALGRQLIGIRLPALLSSLREISLTLCFDEGPWPGAGESVPRVEANVILVWNSITARNPSRLQIEHSVSRTGNKRVHALIPSMAGNRWSAWSVIDVGPARDGSTIIGRKVGRGPGYHLAYLPLSDVEPCEAVSGVDHIVPCVVLSEATCDLLESRKERLVIDYRATLGGCANHLGPGTELHMTDLSGMPVPELLRGTLVTATMGGTDGMEETRIESPTSLTPFLPARGRRTIGEMTAALSRQFGDEIELVDPADLIRTVSTAQAGPLRIRVRFRQPSRRAGEKRAILSACHAFLHRYLTPEDVGGFFLVESSLESDRAITI